MKSTTLPADLDSLSPIRDFVKEASESAGLDKGAGYKLALAIDEIATNTINYGYAGKPGELLLRAEATDDELIVIVEDSAPEFDPRTASLPTADDIATPLADRAIGGLGIYLALSDVDRFDYRRDGNRNVNIFAMKRNKTQESS